MNNKSEQNMTFGEQLTQLREQKRLTRGDVGKAVGTTSTHIAQIEYGSYFPSFDLLQRLCYSLDMTVIFTPEKVEITE